jgi:tRNA dimethylallyltransferase
MCRNLYVITGPTAVGKTELALAWAEVNRAEIVSCDASLFYRGMDIGTAKPTAAERVRVRHWLVDICDVRERMDVTKYVELARAACADIAGRGRKVLVTGGSGFYLKAFFGAVADEVAVVPELRAEIGARLARGATEAGGWGAEGLEDLLAELRGLNPGGLGELDVANPRRVTRALERCRASGKTLAELAAEFAARPGAFAEWDVRAVRLDREPAELRARVEARVAGMLRDGLVGEVRRLRGEGIEDNPSAASAIGYRETLAALAAAEKDGREIGAEEEARLGAEIALNTWGLVRKQRTWFRSQLPADRLRVVAAEGARVEGLF